MQVFAENTGNKEPLDLKDEHASLFSNGEIIFPDENAERPYTRYGYKISDMNFLVPEEIVSEVIQEAKVFNLPNCPSWLEGLVNIRGNIIPVMNMDKLLKKSNYDKSTTLLVLNNIDEKQSIAIIITELPISLEYNESKTKINSYPDILHEYISSGFNQNNYDWVEFNPQKLFEKLAKK